MDKREIFSLLSFVVACAAYVPYIAMTVTDAVRPTIATWISWIVMDLAIYFAMLKAGADTSQMLAFIIGTTCVILVCLFKRSALGWTRSDSVCFAIVVCAVLFWVISGRPEIAIALSLFAATVGSYPMWVNLWTDPTRESLLPWFLIVMSSVLSLLAVKSWTISDALTPLWFGALQIFTICLILRRYKKQVSV